VNRIALGWLETAGEDQHCRKQDSVEATSESGRSFLVRAAAAPAGRDPGRTLPHPDVDPGDRQHGHAEVEKRYENPIRKSADRGDMERDEPFMDAVGGGVAPSRLESDDGPGFAIEKEARSGL